MSLRHPDECPINEGRIVSSAGLDVPVRNYDDHFTEEHGPYLVGPLAHVNLNNDRLSPVAQEAAHDAGLSGPCRNPFQSIVVRAVELLYACEEALRIIAAYEPPDEPAVQVEPPAATGYAATEAPGGMLYHCYRLDERGAITDAKTAFTSTYGAGVAEAIELARVFHRLPKQLTVYAIEGLNFAPGAALSAEVASAVRRLVGQL